MKLNVYELVKSVLDDDYANIEGGEAEKDAKIRAALTDMRERFARLGQKAMGPSYGDHVIRFAYVFCYVTSHANLVYEIIRWNEEIQTLLERDDVKITCVGGGPGSDLLGIVKSLLSTGKKPKINCFICDREALWSDAWGDVGLKLSSDDLTIFTNYTPQDVCVPETWTGKKYVQSDLFTFVYFFSEVYSMKDKATAYFDKLFSEARPGALFLFVDNNSPKFYGWFDELCQKHGIEVVAAEKETMVMPSDEQQDVLADYIAKFGTNTKLKTDVAWRICRKPG